MSTASDLPPSDRPAPPAQRPPGQRTRRSFASLRTIMALVLREMSTTYGSSPGGYIWAILEPVASIALLTAVFSLGFRSPSIGINFPIFYATGMLPFLLYNDLTGKIATALLFSKPLLAYPAVTFIDAIMARFLVNLLTQLMVAYVVFVGILMTFETRTAPDIPVIAQAFAMAGILALGVGTMNSFLFTRFPVWQRIWSVLNRPMFIVSCIFFVFETVPQPYRDVLWYNPLVHIVGLMRRGFYPSYDAVYVSPVYVIGLGMGLLVAGLFLLRRYHRDLLYR